MREKILSIFKKIIPEGFLVEINIPDFEIKGHYSSNIAFALSKEKKQPPMMVAESLAKEITALSPKGFFKRVEAASPGFLNFWISDEAWRKELVEISKKNPPYTKKTKSRKSRRIQVEYVSANPTGPLTLANGRGGFFGDVLSNVLEWLGHKVEREYYVNDTGNQVLTFGKSMLAALGIIPDEETFYKGGYISEWAKKNKKIILAHKDRPLEIGKHAAKDFLKEIKLALEKKANIYFDRYTSEDKDIHKKKFIEKTREIFERKGFVYENEGALWLKTSEFGDDKDRVILTRDRFPTYFLADAGHYLETKLRKFEEKINILGPDHYGYMARLEAAAKILDFPDSKVIITQAVRLIKNGEEIKMSKRKGQFVTFAELVEEVGPDVSRFFFLMHSVDSHMDFDLSLAKERSQKNPVYYAQYAYVRAVNILKKLKTKNLQLKTNLELLDTKEDMNLIRMLIRFPEEIEIAAKELRVHGLTRYAGELARAFHNFYEKERVVGEKEEVLCARAVLVWASKIIFENLFDILGISKPKKM